MVVVGGVLVVRLGLTAVRMAGLFASSDGVMMFPHLHLAVHRRTIPHVCIARPHVSGRRCW